jgi:hypothetical protein
LQQGRPSDIETRMGDSAGSNIEALACDAEQRSGS